MVQLDEIQIMGDPHLGRKFINGVPLERRGEREASVWADFEASLMSAGDYKVHVCLGDLFDRVDVSHDTVVRAALLYNRAARQFPTTWFFVLGGNHDQSKSTDAGAPATSFDAFLMMSNKPNVMVVDSTVVHSHDNLLFFPWAPEGCDFDNPVNEGTIAFGHWDVEDYGNPDHHNLIPTKELAELGVKTAVTGHVHKADAFERDGVEVLVWGSLQPFAHGEDADGERYITLSAAEAQAKIDEDPGVFHDMCLRTVGILDEIPDCLQYKTLSAEDLQEEMESVDFSEGFSIKKLFDAVCDKHGVSKTIREDLMERMLE